MALARLHRVNGIRRVRGSNPPQLHQIISVRDGEKRKRLRKSEAAFRAVLCHRCVRWVRRLAHRLSLRRGRIARIQTL